MLALSCTATGRMRQTNADSAVLRTVAAMAVKVARTVKGNSVVARTVDSRRPAPACLRVVAYRRPDVARTGNGHSAVARRTDSRRPAPAYLWVAASGRVVAYRRPNFVHSLLVKRIRVLGLRGNLELLL